MYTRRIAAHRTRSRQKLSACRESLYDRPADVRMPPEEFFDNRVPLAAVCPETALMYAVLEDAFLCFQRQLEAEGPRIPRAQQAEEWFFSDDFLSLFSFLSVCKMLGLQPQIIRMKLRQWS